MKASTTTGCSFPAGALGSFFRRRECSRPASPLEPAQLNVLPWWNAARQCSGKQGFAWDRCQLPLLLCHTELHHKVQLTPSMVPGRDYPAGLEALPHPFRQIQGKQSRSQKVTWTLLPLFRQTGSPDWLQQCRLKPVCPVRLSSSGISILCCSSRATALCLWQLHIHHGINRKAKALNVLITTLIKLKQNSEFTRPFSYLKLVLVTLYAVGEASSLSIF